MAVVGRVLGKPGNCTPPTAPAEPPIMQQFSNPNTCDGLNPFAREWKPPSNWGAQQQDPAAPPPTAMSPPRAPPPPPPTTTACAKAGRRRRQPQQHTRVPPTAAAAPWRGDVIGMEEAGEEWPPRQDPTGVDEARRVRLRALEARLLTSGFTAICTVPPPPPPPPGVANAGGGTDAVDAGADDAPPPLVAEVEDDDMPPLQFADADGAAEDDDDDSIEAFITPEEAVLQLKDRFTTIAAVTAAVSVASAAEALADRRKTRENQRRKGLPCRRERAERRAAAREMKGGPELTSPPFPALCRPSNEEPWSHLSQSQQGLSDSGAGSRPSSGGRSQDAIMAC